MKPDTLFLSGGGVNCISFLGAFKYLFEKKIINHQFKNIKNIVCVSGSAFYILPLLLGYSLEAVTRICLELDTEKIINDNFDLNNILVNFGLYDNDFIEHMCSVILTSKGLSDKITLVDFYEHTKINLVLKTTNISKYNIEYMNHLSHPTLSLRYAIKMTTCVPLLFRPIKYNKCLYVDGGLCGNYPIEYNKTLKSKNYLGIHIKVKEQHENMDDLSSYINRLQMVPTSPYDNCNKKRKKTRC